MLREKWISIVYHTANIHSWDSADLYEECAHQPIPPAIARTKRWLRPGSSAHNALKEVVFDKNLLKDIQQLALCCHYYRPPKSVSGDYQLQLEGELNGICTWASLRRNFVTVIGDINLDRLRPDKSEGKLLLDLEVEQELTCLIDRPTRTEKKGLSHTSTLIDVLLTNKPERLKCGGVYYPSLSDHALIYGIFQGKTSTTPKKSDNF